MLATIELLSHLDAYPGRLMPGVSRFQGDVKQAFATTIFVMQLIIQAFLLFALNFLDAVLTIYWVKNGYATEGNQLMASLLDVGSVPFLLVKILVGSVAVVVFLRWGHLRMAKVGLAVTLSIYIGLMGVHLFTGLSVSGYLSEALVYNIADWTGHVLGSLI